LHSMPLAHRRRLWLAASLRGASLWEALPIQAACTGSFGSRKLVFCTRHGSESAIGHFSQLEAINGVSYSGETRSSNCERRTGDDGLGGTEAEPPLGYNLKSRVRVARLACHR